jgi:hypothetical protein
MPHNPDCDSLADQADIDAIMSDTDVFCCGNSVAGMTKELAREVYFIVASRLQCPGCGEEGALMRGGLEQYPCRNTKQQRKEKLDRVCGKTGWASMGGVVHCHALLWKAANDSLSRRENYTPAAPRIQPRATRVQSPRKATPRRKRPREDANLDENDCLKQQVALLKEQLQAALNQNQHLLTLAATPKAHPPAEALEEPLEEPQEEPLEEQTVEPQEEQPVEPQEEQTVEPLEKQTVEQPVEQPVEADCTRPMTLAPVTTRSKKKSSLPTNKAQAIAFLSNPPNSQSNVPFTVVYYQTQQMDRLPFSALRQILSCVKVTMANILTINYFPGNRIQFVVKKRGLSQFLADMSPTGFQYCPTYDPYTIRTPLSSVDKGDRMVYGSKDGQYWNPGKESFG